MKKPKANRDYRVETNASTRKEARDKVTWLVASELANMITF